jgi:hypothetical protein
MNYSKMWHSSNIWKRQNRIPQVFLFTKELRESKIHGILVTTIFKMGARGSAVG